VITLPATGCARSCTSVRGGLCLNPRIVYADLTGFGDAGPDAALPGFDVTAYWARYRLLDRMREDGRRPPCPCSQRRLHGGHRIYSAIVTALYTASGPPWRERGDVAARRGDLGTGTPRGRCAGRGKPTG